MSNNVDKRVVEMQFDNKQFENGIQESVKSLDDLKKGLDLEKSAKGLEAIDKAASKIDLSRLSDAAQSVADRFSFMGNLVQNVYNRIGNAALNAIVPVQNFIKALTIDPVQTGMQEYETQINAIQTILSNTRDAMTKQGLSDSERLAIVNDRLDQLNHYADKTIYNFTEMTRNIGTFTAAGVELDTAVQSIQGIANLAAVSGSTSEQASRAMYQLSQAISTGTVRLMDWNSVVNAGMGGEVFQKALQRTAKAMGKTVEYTVTETDKAGKKVKKTVQRTVDEVIAEEGSFRDSLSKGWLTSDILTATLEQFSWDFEQIAKDMGYTSANMEEGVLKAMEMKKSELLAQGYTSEEADEILQLAKDATEAATKVKTFTQLFDTLKEAAQSGWTQTWEYIIGDFEEAKALLTSMSDFFGKIIDESTTARNEIVKGWKDLGGRDELIQSFWNIVYAIQNVVNAVRTEFQKVFPPKTSEQLFNMTRGFRELTDRVKAFTENEEQMDKIRRIVAGMANGLDIVRQVIGGVWQVAKEAFGYISPYAGDLIELIAKVAAKVADKITEFNQRLKETGGVQNAVEKVTNFIKKMVDAVKDFIRATKELFSNDILKSIKTFFSSIGESVKNFATNMDGADIAVILGALLGGGVLLKIRNFIKSLTDIKESICGGIEGIFDGIADTLGSFKSKKDITKSVLNIAASLALIAGALYIVAKIDPDRLGDAVLTMGIMLTAITAFAFILSKIKLKNAAASTGLMLLGSAMLVFASVIERIGKLDGETLVKGIAGLGAVLLELAVFLALTKKANLGVFKVAGLILLAVSINMFANTIKKIGSFETGTIVKGIEGLGAVLLELGIFLALTKKANLGVFKVAGLILLATSISMFASTIEKIGSLDTGTIVKGLTGLGVVLLELAAFMAMVKKSNFGVFKGAGLIPMAVSLNSFAEAIAKIGKLKTKTIIKGVAGLGLVLLEIAAFMKIMNKTKVTGITKSLVMLGVMALSLQVFVKALKHLDGVEMGQMLAFSTSFGVALLSLSASMMLISKVPVTAALAGIAKLALVAAAIVGLMAVFGAAEQAWSVSSYINSFGDMTEAIGKAIGRFVGGLGAGVMQGLNPPQIGSDLSDFMTNIQPFLDGCKGVDESVKTGVGNLASAITAIGGAEIVSAISSWFVGDNPISQFSDDIGIIATALNNFAAGISGFTETDNSNLTNATNAAKGLAELVKAVPWEAPEWAKAVTGSKDVEGFADNAATLATALLNYATNISGFSATISETDVTNSTNAAKALVELQQALPAEGGWIQSLLGIKDLGTFAKRIPSFAAGMVAYAAEISGFTTTVTQDDITNSTNAAMALAGLANSIPTEGGWVQTILGQQDLGTFGEKCAQLGAGLASFAANIGSVSTQKTSNALEAMGLITQFTNGLSNEGGVFNAIGKFFGGQQDIVGLSEKMATVGTNLATFASQLSTADFSNTEQATQLLTDMQSFIGTLETKGGVWADIGAFFGGSKDIVGLSSSMASFANNFSVFASGISGATKAATDFSTVQTIVTAFTTLADSIKEGNVDTGDIEYAAELMADSFVTTMATTISNGGNQVGAAAVALSSSGTTAAQGTYLVWYRTGQNLGKGLSNGISSMAGSVRRAATNAAAGATRAIQITWSVHSPSRVGHDLGMNFDLGIAGGLDRYSRVVSQSAEGIGENAVDSAKTMLRGTDYSIFDFIDPNPTIRPVLDLSDVRSGVGMIGGMLNSDQMLSGGLFNGINFNKGVNALNFDSARIAGGMNNKDVIAELQSLADRFDDLNEAVANMKVVLDSGELVGATSRKMDNQLGELAMRRGRGN